MNKFITILISVTLCSCNAIAQPSPEPETKPVSLLPESETFTTKQQTKSIGQPRTLKFSIQLSSPEDLKVKQGDKVQAGQLLADRTKERQKLELQREQLQISLNKIQSQKVINPPAPAEIPGLLALPEADYSVELAQIEKAKLKLQQIDAKLRQEQAAAIIPPDILQAKLEEAREAEKEAQRQLELQTKKAEAVRDLNLPSHYNDHEKAISENLEAEAKKATAGITNIEAQIGQAINENQFKISQLALDKQQAEAEVKVNFSELEKAKRKRMEDEYNHRLTLIRRVEEANQSESIYAYRKQETDEKRRNQQFQLAEVQSKLTAIEQQLTNLSTVRSPYNGTVRRIKVEKQTNNQLEVSIIMGVE
ncbi:hypothetical protein QUA43_29940 [Microcoleus sp. N9_B4]|uniref:hypothetical protein n=1 Tax=Microcoleus sp. N9_B4 TaxID=3055386 RepID=UPI002FD1B4E7